MGEYSVRLIPLSACRIQLLSLLLFHSAYRPFVAVLDCAAALAFRGEVWEPLSHGSLSSPPKAQVAYQI